MLDAFKKMGSGTAKSMTVQADELQALIATSREERAALSTMLTQIQLHSAKLASAGKALQEVEAQAGKAHGRLDELTARLATADARAHELEAVDARIQALGDAVVRAEQEAARLGGPEGELHRQQQAVLELSARTAETRASLEALGRDRAALEALRAELDATRADVRASAERAGTIREEVEQVRGASTGLATEFARLREVAREAHSEAGATLEIVRDVEQKLEPLSQLREMSRSTEERLTALHALAEHVGQKVKALEGQKHTVERAVVESNRLNEMIWNMEIQVEKLNEAGRHATRTEELIDRVETLAREVEAQLDGGLKARDAFAAELARLEAGRVSLADFVRQHAERLALDRKAFDTFEQRVGVLQAAIGAAEQHLEGLAARDRLAVAVGQRADDVTRRLEGIAAQLDDLEGRQALLSDLQPSLGRLDELARTTARQYEALQPVRQDLEALRGDLQEVHAAQADAVRLRDRLAADRVALEAFLERASAFSAGVPALEARMAGITGQLAVVDEATQKVANLVAITDDLDRQMGRAASQQQFVERVEGRLQALGALSADLDAQLAGQIARAAEVEALRSQIDGVALQVADARQQLEGIGSVQARLLPLAGEVTALESRIADTRSSVEAARREEAELDEQERRLTTMLEQARRVSADAGERLRQVQDLAAGLERSAAVKDELVQELARVQSRQHEVAAHASAADEQLERLEAGARQLAQRRAELAAADTRIGNFEAKFQELRQLSGDLEQKIEGIVRRETLVEAVRQEVEAVQAIGEKSRSDLQYVEAHRGDVVSLRERVDEVLAAIDETETRLGAIDQRKRLVEEVHLKTTAIVNMLDDVRLDMETLGEHKTVMDHVMATFTRLNDTVQEAQSTLRALQAERELAERIERTNRNLRARTSAQDAKKRS